MSRRLTVTLLGLSLLVVDASAQMPPAGPTFDCARATGQIEQLICNDAALAALDRRLAQVYRIATQSWPAEVATTQRVMQRGWIKGRDECWKSADVRACVDTEYRTRIVEIQIMSGQLMAPTPVSFACAGAPDKRVSATFYKDSDPPSVVLTVDDDQVIAFQARSASGARYTATNVEFWDHQGEASITWFDTKMTCRPRK